MPHRASDSLKFLPDQVTLENDASWLDISVSSTMFDHRQLQRLGLIHSFSFHAPE
jgi:hypothetical protein